MCRSDAALGGLLGIQINSVSSWLILPFASVVTRQAVVRAFANTPLPFSFCTTASSLAPLFIIIRRSSYPYFASSQFVGSNITSLAEAFEVQAYVIKYA